MDETVLLWVNHAWAQPWLDALFVWLSAKATFSVPLLAVMMWLLVRRWGKDGAKLGLALVAVIILGDSLGTLLKYLFEQPRPCLELYQQLRHPTHEYQFCEGDLSGMPSNHALNFFATFAFLAIIIRSWRWSLPLLAIALGVAISRVYLGAHYPSQVLAGIAIGTTFGLLLGHASIRWLGFARDIHFHSINKKIETAP